MSNFQKQLDELVRDTAMVVVAGFDPKDDAIIKKIADEVLLLVRKEFASYKKVMDSHIDGAAASGWKNPFDRPRVHKKFPPLTEATEDYVTTDQAAHYLMRKPQTLRGWHCTGEYPKGLIAKNMNGRLCWPVANIRSLLAEGAS